MPTTTSKERHIIIDILCITGGGLVADALSRRNWLAVVGGVVIVVVALLCDRKNRMYEVKEIEIDACPTCESTDKQSYLPGCSILLDRPCNPWHDRYPTNGNS